MNNAMDKFRQYKNYAIIAIVSLFCLFFLPFTGSTADMGFNLPSSPAGWVVYCSGKIIVAIVNILILYCFVEQGKFNVRDNPRFIEACNILLTIDTTNSQKPKSPKEHNFEVFGKKSVALFFSSILSTISLTQAVLSFDYITMLTYLFVIISGIIFGIIQMGQEEIYWTEEYWKYAKLIEKSLKEESHD